MSFFSNNLFVVDVSDFFSNFQEKFSRGITLFFRAYEYFALAAERGHQKALEHLGFGYLLGDYVRLDHTEALKIFQSLSQKGSPKGQLVSVELFWQ